MISTVVGSCIAVCIFDRKQKIGGMNHFQFPVILSAKHATARYGNVAVSTLINLMFNEGSKPEQLEAQILGGAYNSKISDKNIGIDNIKNEIAVVKVDKVRQDDWYPYEIKR